MSSTRPSESKVVQKLENDASQLSYMGFVNAGRDAMAIAQNTKFEDGINPVKNGLTLKGYYEQAVKHFTHAIEINPYNSLAFKERRVAYMKLAKIDASEDDITLYKKLARTDTEKSIKLESELNTYKKNQLNKPALFYHFKKNASLDETDIALGLELQFYADKFLQARKTAHTPSAFHKEIESCLAAAADYIDTPQHALLQAEFYLDEDREKAKTIIDNVVNNDRYALAYYFRAEHFGEEHKDKGLQQSQDMKSFIKQADIEDLQEKKNDFLKIVRMSLNLPQTYSLRDTTIHSEALEKASDLQKLATTLSDEGFTLQTEARKLAREAKAVEEKDEAKAALLKTKVHELLTESRHKSVAYLENLTASNNVLLSEFNCGKFSIDSFQTLLENYIALEDFNNAHLMASYIQYLYISKTSIPYDQQSKQDIFGRALLRSFTALNSGSADQAYYAIGNTSSHEVNAVSSLAKLLQQYIPVMIEKINKYMEYVCQDKPEVHAMTLETVSRDIAIYFKIYARIISWNDDVNFQLELSQFTTLTKTKNMPLNLYLSKELSNIYNMLSKFDSYVKQLQKQADNDALQFIEISIDTITAQSQMLLSQGDTAKALAVLSPLMVYESHYLSYKLFKQRAFVYLAMAEKNPEDEAKLLHTALQDFDKSIALEPGEIDTYNKYVQVLKKLHLSADAFEKDMEVMKKEKLLFDTNYFSSLRWILSKSIFADTYQIKSLVNLPFQFPAQINHSNTILFLGCLALGRKNVERATHLQEYATRLFTHNFSSVTSNNKDNMKGLNQICNAYNYAPAFLYRAHLHLLDNNLASALKDVEFLLAYVTPDTYFVVDLYKQFIQKIFTGNKPSVKTLAHMAPREINFLENEIKKALALSKPEDTLKRFDKLISQGYCTRKLYACRSAIFTKMDRNFESLQNLKFAHILSDDPLSENNCLDVALGSVIFDEPLHALIWINYVKVKHGLVSSDKTKAIFQEALNGANDFHNKGMFENCLQYIEVLIALDHQKNLLKSYKHLIDAAISVSKMPEEIINFWQDIIKVENVTDNVSEKVIPKESEAKEGDKKNKSHRAKKVKNPIVTPPVSKQNKIAALNPQDEALASENEEVDKPDLTVATIENVESETSDNKKTNRRKKKDRRKKDKAKDSKDEKEVTTSSEPILDTSEITESKDNSTNINSVEDNSFAEPENTIISESPTTQILQFINSVPTAEIKQETVYTIDLLPIEISMSQQFKSSYPDKRFLGVGMNIADRVMAKYSKLDCEINLAESDNDFRAEGTQEELSKLYKDKPNVHFPDLGNKGIKLVTFSEDNKPVDITYDISLQDLTLVATKCDWLPLFLEIRDGVGYIEDPLNIIPDMLQGKLIPAKNLDELFTDDPIRILRGIYHISKRPFFSFPESFDVAGKIEQYKHLLQAPQRNPDIFRFFKNKVFAKPHCQRMFRFLFDYNILQALIPAEHIESILENKEWIIQESANFKDWDDLNSALLSCSYLTKTIKLNNQFSVSNVLVTNALQQNFYSVCNQPPMSIVNFEENNFCKKLFPSAGKSLAVKNKRLLQYATSWQQYQANLHKIALNSAEEKNYIGNQTSFFFLFQKTDESLVELKKNHNKGYYALIHQDWAAALIALQSAITQAEKNYLEPAYLTILYRDLATVFHKLSAQCNDLAAKFNYTEALRYLQLSSPKYAAYQYAQTFTEVSLELANILVKENISAAIFQSQQAALEITNNLFEHLDNGHFRELVYRSINHAFKNMTVCIEQFVKLKAFDECMQLCFNFQFFLTQVPLKIDVTHLSQQILKIKAHLSSLQADFEFEQGNFTSCLEHASNVWGELRGTAPSAELNLLIARSELNTFNSHVKLAEQALVNQNYTQAQQHFVFALKVPFNVKLPNFSYEEKRMSVSLELAKVNATLVKLPLSVKGASPLQNINFTSNSSPNHNSYTSSPIQNQSVTEEFRNSPLPFSNSLSNANNINKTIQGQQKFFKPTPNIPSSRNNNNNTSQNKNTSQ